MSRVMWRLMPILMVGYFCAYLDRVNTGFAGLTMTKALGFSSTVFGFGGGIFFIGYFLFEIPSNLLMNRVGARRWIARILVTWALVSAMTAFVTGPSSFFGIRFVLGLAEAGFFPGVILYLTWWFPSYYRARMVGWFMTAIPISNILGSLVSSPILSMNGFLGFQGWQWLFLIEAVPPIILGVVVMFYLTDRPSEAKWLTPAQRQWLTQRIEAEQKQREAVRHYGLGDALRSLRVWGLTAGYFGQSMAGYGLVMFLPQIVHKFGVRVSEVGLITAIPYVFSATFMVWWSMRSDRTGERVKHFVIASVMASTGLVLCLVLRQPAIHAGCPDFCADGAVRDFADVLAVADCHADGYRGGGRHCLDQCGWQPWRLLRAVSHGIYPGRDRQLPARSVGAGDGHPRLRGGGRGAWA